MMRSSGSPDGRIPDFRKPGFPCLPHYGKCNKNNDLRAPAPLASTLQYKRHGRPRPDNYSKETFDDRRLPLPLDVLRHRLLRHGSRAGECQGALPPSSFFPARVTPSYRLISTFIRNRREEETHL
jgi:hypothetical protein